MWVCYLDGQEIMTVKDEYDAECWAEAYEGEKTTSYECVCDYCGHTIKDNPFFAEGMDFCDGKCRDEMLDTLSWENKCEGRLG